MPNHNPFMIAHRIAQLDHMARGRFQWGVGSGGFPGDFEVFGFDPRGDGHRKMTRESIDTIIRIWNDPKPGVYESEFWRFTIPEPVDKSRSAVPRHAIPEATPADWRRGSVPELRHADPRRRARMDTDEHQPRTIAHPQHTLGRG